MFLKQQQPKKIPQCEMNKGILFHSIPFYTILFKKYKCYKHIGKQHTQQSAHLYLSNQSNLTNSSLTGGSRS